MAPERHPTPEVALRQSAEELWGILSSPFERDFDAVGYTAHLTLPVNPNAGLFTDEVAQDYFRILAGAPLGRNRPWDITLSHVASEDRLGVTELSLPLYTSEADDLLVLRHTRYGYIPFLSDGAQERVLSYTDEPTSSLHAISPDFVNEMLGKVGYFVSDLAQNPDSLRLGLSQISDKAQELELKESVTVLADSSLQTTFTRTIRRLVDSQDVPSGEGVKKKYRDLFISELSGVSEIITPDAQKRNQIEVTFIGEDYTVFLPTIHVQKLELADQILGVEGTRTYRIKERFEVPPTLVNISKLAEAFTDSLTGL